MYYMHWWFVLNADDMFYIFPLKSLILELRHLSQGLPVRFTIEAFTWLLEACPKWGKILHSVDLVDFWIAHGRALSAWLYFFDVRRE